MQNPPFLVTVFYGANDDVLVDGPNARQHVPLEKYKENLENIVDHIRAVGCENVILITPPPVWEEARLQALREEEPTLENPSIDRTLSESGRYAQMCISVAKSKGVPVVDLWSGFQQHQDWGTGLLNDGLHFTPEGNRVVFNLLTSIMDKEFPQLRVEELPLDLPLHPDVVPSNPQEGMNKYMEHMDKFLEGHKGRS